MKPTLTNDIAFQRQDGKVVYFYGHPPIFSRAENDLPSFRPFTNQLLKQGSVRPAEIVQAFGVPANALHKAIRAGRLHAVKKKP